MSIFMLTGILMNKVTIRLKKNLSFTILYTFYPLLKKIILFYIFLQLGCKQSDNKEVLLEIDDYKVTKDEFVKLANTLNITIDSYANY